MIFYISYSNIFGNLYAFNYINFKNINNFNYQEFLILNLWFLKLNIINLLFLILIQPMNISFLKIKNIEDFIIYLIRENQKEIQINSSDILYTKITFHPKSNDDNNSNNKIKR